MYDVSRGRQDVPLLNRTVNGKPLVYLDHAATSRKPRAAIAALVEYDELGVAATARASLYLYNTREAIDTLVAALGKVQALFRRVVARV